MTRLLKFFVDAHAKLRDIRESHLSLEDVRSKADYTSRTFSTPGYLGALLKAESGLRHVPVITHSEEHRKAFGLSESSSLDNDFGVVAVLDLPQKLEDAQHTQSETQNFLKNLSSSVLLFRYGFLSNEYDVYETVLQGYRGVTVFASDHEIYTLQLITEVCRDMKLSCVLVAHDNESLGRVLETDCPYIGIWGYEDEEPRLKWKMLLELVPQIPKTCLALAMCPDLSVAQKMQLQSLGLRAHFS